jgi:hypothetical protein
MTILANTSLSMSNSSFVFAQQNAYTSMELYSLIFGSFVVFLLASWFLDGQTKPFEKILASLIAFIISVCSALTSFSIAIVSSIDAGFIQGAGKDITQQQAILPTIIMQNSITWEVICWIIVALTFINIINSIIVLVDYSRITGVKKGGL